MTCVENPRSPRRVRLARACAQVGRKATEELEYLETLREERLDAAIAVAEAVQECEGKVRAATAAKEEALALQAQQDAVVAASKCTAPHTTEFRFHVRCRLFTCALLHSTDELVDPSITSKAIGHRWYRSYETHNSHNTHNPMYFAVRGLCR
eukprot:1195783-Prorocentrum_minimum.AAC.2